MDKLGKVIRVNLGTLEAKEKIMTTKATILKSSELSISHDLTNRELTQRNNLIKLAEEKKKLEMKTFLKGNKLKNWFLWAIQSNAAIQMRPAHIKNGNNNYASSSVTHISKN